MRAPAKMVLDRLVESEDSFLRWLLTYRSPSPSVEPFLAQCFLCALHDLLASNSIFIEGDVLRNMHAPRVVVVCWRKNNLK